MIKLLALDLDGTLLNSRGEIPPENSEAILKAEAKGVLVTIVTGRRFRDARPVGLALNLNAPVICHNGALTKYAESLETVKVSLLPNTTLHEIIRAGRSFGADAMLSCDPIGKGTLFYDRISAENIPLQKYVEWSRRLHGEEAEQAVHHVESLESILDENETVHASFSGTCEPMYALQRVLEDELGDSVNILATIYPHVDFTLLDILPAGASKGVGLANLAELNGFTHENVMAIGDNFNDLEMLEYAGTAVAMGNAAPGLIEDNEFETTASNDEAGVARAIERFILN